MLGQLIQGGASRSSQNPYHHLRLRLAKHRQTRLIIQGHLTLVPTQTLKIKEAKQNQEFQ